MENHRNLLTKRSFSAWIKTVACILSILLVMYAVPTIVYAELIDAMESVNTTDETVPVEEKEIEKGTVFEVVDRREETVKHFRTEDGSFTAVQYNVPVHEKDENGEWQDIDNTLSESGNEYATSNARIKFAKKTTGNSTLFELHDGNRKITMSLSGARKKVEGQVTNTQTEFPEDATQLQRMMTLDKLSSKILYPNILDGVDLEYVVNSCNIKENIIVKERADSYSYTFEIQLNNLDAVLCEDGSVAIADPDTDEVVYMIPKGYMFDADGAYSDAVVYTLTNGGSGKYTLTVVADAEWINDESRTLPVTIDPPITVSSETGITDTYIDSDNPSSAYYSLSYLASGTGAVGQEFISYWRSSSLPIIPDSAFVVSAEFSLYCRDYRVHTGTASSIRIGVYRVTSDWNANITWTKHTSANAGAFALTTLIDFADVSVTSEGKYVSWDITRLYKQWNEGTPNYGIALAQLTQGGNDALLASSESANDPILTVCYRDMKGIESYWSGSSHSAGLAGSGYVNHASGNLVFSISTVSTTDSLFDYMPVLVYNSAMTDKYNYTQHNNNVPYRYLSSGYGWKLSTNESIVKPKDADYYVWSDGDGTEHYFLPATSGASGVYKDEDGLLLTLTVSDGGYTITDIDGNSRYFKKITTSTAIAEGGTLQTITDIYGNKLEFSLNGYDQTTAVSVVPNGHTMPLEYLTFTYNSMHALTEIRNSFTQQVVSFSYASSYTNTTAVGSTYAGPLYQVKFGYLSGSNIVYDSTVTYTYTSAMGTTYGSVYRLATATDDSTGLSIHYNYDTVGRLASVTEYSGTTVGQSIRYTYGAGYTEIRSSGNDDILQTGTNSDDIITHYSFDNHGRPVSAYSTGADRTAMYGAANQVYTDPNEDGDNTVNSLKSSTVIDSVATNHMYNGGFDLDRTAVKGWGKSSANVKIAFDYNLHNDVLGMTTEANGTEYIYQDVSLSAGTYTLSAECMATVTGMDFILSVYDGSTEIASETYSVTVCPSVPYAMNPSLTFTLAESKTVRVKLTSKGAATGIGILSVENVSLVNTIGIPSYNMVQFGGFGDTYADTNGSAAPIMVWQTMLAPGAAMSSEGGLFGECLRITGNVNWLQRVTQRVTVLPDGVLDQIAPGNVSGVNPIYYQGRAFTVSGFAKASAQVANEDALFALSVSVYYYGESEPEKIDIPFNKDLTDWQFVSKTIFAPSDKIVQHIDISCVYTHQPNVAYFDNISLVEEKGTNAANYVYNDKGLLEFTYTPADCTYYEYDGSNNLTVVLDSQGNGRYYQYSGGVLQSETTFKYRTRKWDLLAWYIDPEREGASVLSAAGLLCAVITKTEYNINAYGLNTTTVTYAATGLVTEAYQKDNTPRLVSSVGHNLTEGSKLFGRVTSTRDTNGNVIMYGYDSRGWLLYERNMAYEGLYYTYDALGRVSSITPILYAPTLEAVFPMPGVEKAQYIYDSQTNRLSQISTATATYTFSYDAFGNTSQIKVGDQLLAAYTYHARNGKLWRMQYGTNKIIEYQYDDLDRIQEICYTDNKGVPQSYKYVYTVTGAIHSVESTESGRLYLYNYDSKGQLIGYTECGKDGNGDYTTLLQNFYLYDEKDRVEQVDSVFAYQVSGTATTDVVIYTYDYLDNSASTPTNVGELGSLTVLEAGLNRESTISYEYDSFYRLKKKTLETPGALAISTEYVFQANTVGTSTQLDSYISTVTGSSGTATTSYSYSYDGDGNITQIVDGNGKKTTYVYDDLGQLIRENIEAQNKTYVYTYDNGGNRTSKKTYAYTTAASLSSLEYTEIIYTYGNAVWGDQMTAVGTTAIAYDAIGNPTTYNGYSLTWDGRQLKKMEKTNSVIEFLYNADGIRTSKTVNGTEHVYTLNGSQIVSETRGDILLIYLYDESGSPIGMQYRKSSYAAGVYDTFYFEKNLQGDIIAIYTESGRKILEYTYDAWGNHSVTWTYLTMETLPAGTNPFRYRGYYYDTDTQLYYLQSRYYNPQWGRFLNADGYVNANGNLIGFNMYAYCSNNPVMYADSLGTDAYLIVTHMFGWNFSPLLGHSFLLVEDENGQWYITQFQKRPDEGGIKVYTEPISDPYAYIGKYDLYVYLKGDFSKCVGYAEMAENYFPPYSFLFNNCLQYNVHVLRQGDIYDEGYKNFIANNNGLCPTTYIKKLKEAKSSAIWSLPLSPLPSASPYKETWNAKKMLVQTCAM